jgi:hypothetical protein
VARALLLLLTIAGCAERALEVPATVPPAADAATTIDLACAAAGCPARDPKFGDPCCYVGERNMPPCQYTTSHCIDVCTCTPQGWSCGCLD